MIEELDKLMSDVDILEANYQAALSANDKETAIEVLRELDQINRRLDELEQ